jgi:hypothetical protein
MVSNKSSKFVGCAQVCDDYTTACHSNRIQQHNTTTEYNNRIQQQNTTTEYNTTQRDKIGLL